MYISAPYFSQINSSFQKIEILPICMENMDFVFSLACYLIFFCFWLCGGCCLIHEAAYFHDRWSNLNVSYLKINDEVWLWRKFFFVWNIFFLWNNMGWGQEQVSTSIHTKAAPEEHNEQGRQTEHGAAVCMGGRREDTVTISNTGCNLLTRSSTMVSSRKQSPLQPLWTLQPQEAKCLPKQSSKGNRQPFRSRAAGCAWLTEAVSTSHSLTPHTLWEGVPRLKNCSAWWQSFGRRWACGGASGSHRRRLTGRIIPYHPWDRCIGQPQHKKWRICYLLTTKL